MIFEKRWISLLAICLVSSSMAQSDEDSSNNDGKQGTYKSGIEKILQGLLDTVNSSAARSSENTLGNIVGWIIPDSVEDAAGKTFGEILNTFEQNFHAIFPGTLWCGAGNIASSENDVGLFNRTDACCRQHDNCQYNLEAGQSVGNIVNDGIFTRSNCTCDNAFYECLKNVDSLISSNIGVTYFNILRPQCFMKDYPIESCAEYGSNRIFDQKCYAYTLNTTAPRTLEWFDNPDF